VCEIALLQRRIDDDDEVDRLHRSVGRDGGTVDVNRGSLVYYQGRYNMCGRECRDRRRRVRRAS